MTYTVRAENGNSRECESRSEAEDVKADMERLGMTVEIDGPEQETDGGEVETKEPIVQDSIEGETSDTTGELTDVNAFQQDPIAYLESINSEFVNTIKGTPAISKRGFRFMQTELGISTSAEVVTTFDDPTGVVIHARAEMPDGRFAEAHGEGYLSENDVSDNEFVRYADSRAKNRAISDLTAAGALAESELSG